MRSQVPPAGQTRKFNLVIKVDGPAIAALTMLTIDSRSSSQRISDITRTIKSRDFMTVSDIKIIDQRQYLHFNHKQADAIIAEDSSKVISEGKLE